MGLKIKTGFIFLIAITSLCGCASTQLTSASKDVAKAFNTDNEAIILFSSKAENCVPSITYQNLDTGQTYSGESFVGSASYLLKKGGYDLIKVPPGTYSPVSFECLGGDSRDFRTKETYKNIPDYIKPLTVKAGEVLYPGTIHMNRDWVNWETGKEESTFTQMFDFSRPTDLVTQYKIKDDTQKYRDAFSNKFPSLSQHFVSRISEQIDDPVDRAMVDAKDDHENYAKIRSLSKKLKIGRKELKNFKKTYGEVSQITDPKLKQDYYALLLEQLNDQKVFLETLIARQIRADDSKMQQQLRQVNQLAVMTRLAMHLHANKNGLSSNDQK